MPHLNNFHGGRSLNRIVLLRVCLNISLSLPSLGALAYVLCYCRLFVLFMFWRRQVTVLVVTWQLLSQWSCEMNALILSRGYRSCCIPSCKASTFSCRRWCRIGSGLISRPVTCATMWQCIWKATPTTRTHTATTATSILAYYRTTLKLSWRFSHCQPNIDITTSDQHRSRSISSCGTGWRISFWIRTFHHSLLNRCPVYQRLLCWRLKTIHCETKRCCMCCDWRRQALSWSTYISRDITVTFILEWIMSFRILGDIYEYRMYVI